MKFLTLTGVALLGGLVLLDSEGEAAATHGLTRREDRLALAVAPQQGLAVAPQQGLASIVQRLLSKPTYKPCNNYGKSPCKLNNNGVGEGYCCPTTSSENAGHCPPFKSDCGV